VRNKTMIMRRLAVILAIACIYSEANAIGKNYRPIEIPLGPFDLRPILEVSESYNDNIFFNNNLRKSSMLTQVRSGFQLALKRKLNSYAFNYAFQSQQYHSSPQDNYVDQYIGGQAHVEFTRRNRLDIEASFVDGHYRRGTTFSQGVVGIQSIKEPNAFHNISAHARYRYGGVKAKGNLELAVDFDDLEFTNNPQQTRGWDRTDITITPGFFYRVFPKTHALIQLEQTFVDYKNNNVPGVANSDYTKQRYLLGVSWDYSAKTQGKARFGYLRQVLDASDTQPASGFSWDVALLWKPKPYSQLGFSFNRDVRPTFGFGSGRLIESYRSTWIHDWNSRISTGLTGAYLNVDNRGSGRHDDIIGVGFNANYNLGKWLGVGINYSYLDQDSTSNNLDFYQNVIMFYIAANSAISKSMPTPWQDWY